MQQVNNKTLRNYIKIIQMNIHKYKKTIHLIEYDIPMLTTHVIIFLIHMDLGFCGNQHNP